MRFLVWRFLGILSLGVAAFFLAIIASNYNWDLVFHYLFDYNPEIFYGYILGLFGAAIFLSIEDVKKGSQ